LDPTPKLAFLLPLGENFEQPAERRTNQGGGSPARPRSKIDPAVTDNNPGQLPVVGGLGKFLAVKSKSSSLFGRGNPAASSRRRAPAVGAVVALGYH
jgi:hypothetical protein